MSEITLTARGYETTVDIIVQRVQIGGPHKVVYEKQPATLHERYDEAVREAFATAKKWAKYHSCRVRIVDQTRDRTTEINGLPLRAADIAAIVPLDTPHRAFVLAALGAKIGKSRLTLDPADVAVALQDHPTTSRVSALRSYAAGAKERAEGRAQDSRTAQILREAAEEKEAMAELLLGDDWIDHLDSADQMIYEIDH